MLDGDGCVAIVRQTYPDRNANYRLVVQVTQNCLQTLQHFRSCVGVTAPIHEVKRRIGHNRQVYTLNYAGPKALFEEMGNIGPDLQADLDRVQAAGIPVDIVFKQGPEVLGL